MITSAFARFSSTSVTLSLLQPNNKIFVESKNHKLKLQMNKWLIDQPGNEFFQSRLFCDGVAK
jgi:hypothetical protein